MWFIESILSDNSGSPHAIVKSLLLHCRGVGQLVCATVRANTQQFPTHAHRCFQIGGSRTRFATSWTRTPNRPGDNGSAGSRHGIGRETAGRNPRSWLKGCWQTSTAYWLETKRFELHCSVVGTDGAGGERDHAHEAGGSVVHDVGLFFSHLDMDSIGWVEKHIVYREIGCRGWSFADPSHHRHDNCVSAHSDKQADFFCAPRNDDRDFQRATWKVCGHFGKTAVVSDSFRAAEDRAREPHVG